MRTKSKYMNGQPRGGTPGKATDTGCQAGRHKKDYHKQEMNEPNSYELSLKLHDLLVGMGRIVRMNTKDGNTFWVEYADKCTGKWKLIK